MSLQEKEIDTDSQKEWCHVMMELEVGMMNLQAKGRQDGQWPPEAGREACSRSWLQKEPALFHLGSRFLASRTVRKQISVI